MNYTCNSGYTLLGMATVSCLTSGEWSSPPPTCSGRFRSNSHILVYVTYLQTCLSVIRINNILLQLSTVVHRPPSPTDLLGHYLTQPLEAW